MRNGHWRISDHGVDDIALELPERERHDRRDQIVAAVAAHYRAPNSRILQYAGLKLIEPAAAGRSKP